VYVGKMIVDRVGRYGTFEGKSVIVVPNYFIRRYGVKRDDGTWSVYHMRGDGKAQRVGFRPIADYQFTEPQPVPGIDTQGA